MGQSDHTHTYSLNDLPNLEKQVLEELYSIKNEQAAEEFRLKYLSKKGIFRALVKGVRDIPMSERKTYGAQANTLKSKVEAIFKSAPWNSDACPVDTDSKIDPSLPSWPIRLGSIHPLMKIREEICSIFFRMGFSIAYGPDVESDYYNFEALNFPPHHPARQMQDTFFVSDDILLRTHTSPVQIRVMEQQKPPIRHIMPGTVYRNEEISSRSNCQFIQVEGLYIDTDVTMADLKGTLLAFAKSFFGEDSEIKIRPSFFPFTEPSIEIDVRCFLCKGDGCSVCKKTGWLEILGAGMVHPNVLRSGNIDPDVYSGFAFGMGIERIALLKYQINDIRLFYENDTRFLTQF